MLFFLFECKLIEIVRNCDKKMRVSGLIILCVTPVLSPPRFGHSLLLERLVGSGVFENEFKIQDWIVVMHRSKCDP